jgi:hypothetical protein
MNNLDFDNDSSYDQTDPDWSTKKTSWTTGDGWEPIGGYYTPFTGTLDGQDYTISNLLIDTPTDIYDVALFGSNDGTIENLGILNADITGHDNPSPTPGEFTGALIGYNRGIVNNCYSTGSISTNANFAGGLIGYTDNGTITYSYSEASVTYTGADYDTGYGGLVGNNYGDSIIDHCYATGLVSELNSEHTGVAAGGLVGDNEGGTITNSYATGNVLGFFESVGGLAGQASYGDILNSYATGSVEGLYDSIGGLIGYVYTSNISSSFATGSVEGDDALGGLLGKVGSTSTGSYISDCYATGDITENDYTAVGGDGYEIGGLIGYAIGYTRLDNSYSTGYITSGGEYADDVGGLIGSSNSPYITNSFWNIETSGRSQSYGATGKTTTELQSIQTFNDISTEGLDIAWDISILEDFDPEDPTIWFINDTLDYPKLFIEYEDSEEPSEDPIEEDEDAQVTTSTPTNITKTSVQLNGNITTLGTYDSAEIYFQYKETGGTWISTTKISRTSTGSFSKILTNLDPYTDYEFRSIIEFGETSIGYGSISYFKTLKIDLPKVVITDIGLIDDVPNLDNMLYYFTSQTPLIKGTAYPNSNVKFETDDEEFNTQVDANGNFDILLDLPRETIEFTYFSYSSFGNQSDNKTLTLVIGTENFPPDDDEEEEEEEEEENNEEEQNEEQENSQEEESDVAGENTTITFTDKDGNPLDGATIEIDGKTYTTNDNGEIEIAVLQEGIHTAKINYKGKEYTQEILSTKDEKHNITIEIDLVERNVQWNKILIYSGLGLLLIIVLIIIFRKREDDLE